MLLSFALSLLLVQQAIDFPTQPPKVARDVSRDTAEIYRLLVADRLAANGEAPDGKYLVVINQTTVFCREGDHPPANTSCIFPMVDTSILNTTTLPLVDKALKKRLVDTNREPRPIMNLGTPSATLVSLEIIDSIFSGKGWWPGFYRRFPESRGYLEFSAPVFDESGQSALVYVSHSCGGLCGTGWLIELLRRPDGWAIANRHMLWIS